jgi:FAD/FMN-containing dehydrogenase
MENEEFFDHSHTADRILFGVVKKYYGSISAEHGVGLLKRDFLHFTRSSKEIELMKGIKAVFDPNGILNPGKVLV